MGIVYSCLASVIVAFSFLTPTRLTAHAGAPTPPTPKQLYRKHCAECHGLDGQAKTTKAKFNHARDIADAQWQDDVTDERIFNSITNGRNVRGNMPAFGDKLNEAQVNSLVTFVRGLRK
jgi:mono/diheme cytochrome c family protein